MLPICISARPSRDVAINLRMHQSFEDAHNVINIPAHPYVTPVTMLHPSKLLTALVYLWWWGLILSKWTPPPRTSPVYFGSTPCICQWQASIFDLPHTLLIASCSFYHPLMPTCIPVVSSALCTLLNTTFYLTSRWPCISSVLYYYWRMPMPLFGKEGCGQGTVVGSSTLAGVSWHAAICVCLCSFCCLAVSW